MPATYKSHIRTAREYLAGATCMAGDLILFADFYLKPKAGRAADVDNLAGGIMDAMNGICYKDDSQVTELRARRVKAEKDEIKIRLVQPQ